jgi:transcription elongation factor Elf1
MRHRVIRTHQLKHLLLCLKCRSVKMSQIIKRKSTPNTRAGQYMCAECGKIFDTKKEWENHQRDHNPHLNGGIVKSVGNNKP